MVLALLSLRALTISWGNLCWCPSNQSLWKLAMPFSVLGYHKLFSSKIFCSEALAQRFTSLPYLRLISTCIFCSSVESCLLITSAFSSSTLTPRHLISNNNGINRHSMSSTFSRFCSLISSFNFFQSFKVSAASCSA